MSIRMSRMALILAGHDNRPIALPRSAVTRLRELSLFLWGTGPFACEVRVIDVEDGSARGNIA